MRNSRQVLTTILVSDISKTSQGRNRLFDSCHPCPYSPKSELNYSDEHIGITCAVAIFMSVLGGVNFWFLGSKP